MRVYALILFKKKTYEVFIFVSHFAIMQYLVLFYPIKYVGVCVYKRCDWFSSTQ